ncbi:MAG TPA: tyrosine--tRNA ligase, partial [Tissierellaceae bacterium]
MANVFDILKERGYIDQATFEDELKEKLGNESISFYVGFDATADSLTLGHFIQIMVMMHMQQAGHRPVALLGGGTTLVGDPSGRTEMRRIMTKETIDYNAKKFDEQLSRFLDFSDDKAKIVNNADWLLDINFLDFMREVGVHFSVSQMLTLDAYKNRINDGLTFFEFSYLLMQSYDYLRLFQQENCILQVGGSDQWSNILGGYNLIRKVEDEKVYAMTFNLLTTAAGTKMGKTEAGTIWLDKDKTPPYELFQYLRNVDDRDVEKFLAQLTFLPMDEVRRLGSLEGSEINKAKTVLAYEVTKLIHGEEEAQKAKAASESLFKGDKDSDSIPFTEMEKSLFEEGLGLLNLLTELEIAKSNGEARRLIQQGGISINEEKVEDFNKVVTLEDFEDDKLLIRKGRKFY